VASSQFFFREVSSALREDAIRDLVPAKFSPGGIHTKLQFWESELNAGPWVLDLIKNGYKVPFRVEPPRGILDNNSTVKDNLEIAELQVKDLLQQGVLERVSYVPHCVSPLGLVTKTINGVVKHRLIFDGSRLINDHVQPPTVKLSYLQKALLKIQKNQLLGVFDLKSCYYHIKLHPDHTKYFGVKLTIDGIPSYMVYKFLPFGLNSAVHCVTKVWKPLIAYFQVRNIPLSVYIDDGLFAANDPVAWNQTRLFVWNTLALAGWTIEMAKSDGPDMGAMSKQYLGFIINTREMKVFLPQEKSLQMVTLLDDFVNVQSCPVKTLAKVLGKVVSCVPSHGPHARVCTRSGYRDLQAQVDAAGWNARVRISDNCKRELRLFKSILGPRNGYPMLNQLTDVRIDALFNEPICKNPVISQARGNYDAIIASDASSYKVVCKWLEGVQHGNLSFVLSADEQGYSSGERELLAMHKAFLHFDKVLQLNHLNLIWATDSQNLVSFISKGSTNPRIHDLVVDIYGLCHKMNCTVEPIHLLREDERIQQVDYLSKIPDTDNWSIDDFNFTKFKTEFALTIDVFADGSNKRLPMFISKNYEAHCWAVDAFANEWPGVAWVCPPTTLLARVASRIRKSPCEGILILPNWPASDFFTSFFEAQMKIRAPFQIISEFKPYIFQNENATSTPLFGITNFTFFALYFNTRSTYVVY